MAKPKFSKEYEIYMCNEYLAGRTTTDIARECGCSGGTVFQILRRHNIAIRSQKSLTAEQELALVALYATGMCVNSVGKSFNVSRATAARVLTRHGIEIRGNEFTSRLHEFDRRFFNIIDTEKKAYWLGFLMADGCNTAGMLGICLSSKDLVLLEQFKEDIKAGHSIRHSKERNLIYFSIQNKLLCEDLASHGIIPRKTFAAAWPHHLSLEMQRHFARGYFDGDGCAFGDMFMVHGHRPFIADYQRFLVSSVEGLSFTKIIQHVGCVKMNYRGRFQVARIRDFLYKDATRYLDRKYKILCNVDSYAASLCAASRKAA